MLFRAEAEIELAFNMDASETENNAEENAGETEENAEGGENAEGNENTEGGEESNSAKLRKISVLVRGNSLTTADELKELTPQQFRWLMEGLSIYQKKVIQPVRKQLIF